MEDQNIALQSAGENQIAKFDYNSLDQEIASFLKDKSKKIIDLRMKSILAIGKELHEAQDKLASHNKYEGVFIKWADSMGIRKSTAYDYIRAYDYVVRNSDNINDPEKIQQSLLFAISKPSAPPELQKAVLDGDITTHKEYQALLKQKEEIDAERQKLALRVSSVEEELEDEAELRKDLEKRLKDHGKKTVEVEKQLESITTQYNQTSIELQNTRKQLDKAKASGKPEDVEALKISLKALDEEVSKLNKEKEDLHRQLIAKPIEAQAVKVVEKVVVPEAIRSGISDKVNSLLWTLQNLSDEEMDIYLASNGSDGVVIEQTEACIRRLQTLINKANVSMNDADPQHDGEGRKCEDCTHCSWDGLKEEDEVDGKVFCTNPKMCGSQAQMLVTADACGYFEER